MRHSSSPFSLLLLHHWTANITWSRQAFASTLRQSQNCRLSVTLESQTSELAGMNLNEEVREQTSRTSPDPRSSFAGLFHLLHSFPIYFSFPLSLSLSLPLHRLTPQLELQIDWERAFPGGKMVSVFMISVYLCRRSAVTCQRN